MAPGRKQLQHVQIGKQTLFDTLVPTTTIWRGRGSMPDDQRKIEEIDELVGLFGEGTDRTAVTQLLAGLELSETPLSFEQAQYLFAMGWGGPTTGVADGVGTDKIYETAVPTTSGVTPVYYSVEGGDDFEVETVENCVATKVSISGKMGETNRMSATLVGSEVVAAGGFTAAIGIPVVEDSICQLGKVYLDPVSGAYGATQVATTIISHKLDIEMMWVPIYGMAGQLTPTAFRYAGHKITGELLYLHDTAAGGAAGAKKFFRDQTPKLLRVDLEGNSVATGGTLYQEKHFIYDLPVKFTKAAVLGDNDGISTVAMTYRSRYNVTAGNAGKIIVVNELTALT